MVFQGVVEHIDSSINNNFRRNYRVRDRFIYFKCGQVNAKLFYTIVTKLQFTYMNYHGVIYYII